MISLIEIYIYIDIYIYILYKSSILINKEYIELIINMNTIRFWNNMCSEYVLIHIKDYTIIVNYSLAHYTGHPGDSPGPINILVILDFNTEIRQRLTTYCLNYKHKNKICINSFEIYFQFIFINNF